MLKKIVAVSNLGKFKNYQAGGDVELRKINVIYADNGQGKTTLGAIFRSLSENNPSILQGRRTLGQNDPVSVHLRFENDTVTFQNDTWSRHVPRFEVFDTRFIQENIYVGSQIGIENKRALYKFVVGTTGVGLARDLDAIDDAIKNTTSEINAIERELRRTIKSSLTIDDFLTLSSANNQTLDQEITQKESDLRASKKSDEIRSKPLLRSVTFSLPDLQSIESVLGQKMENLSEEAVNTIKDKVSKLGDNSQSWLAQGSKYLNTSACPFCEQDIEGINLVHAYRTIFSQKYQRLQGDLTRLRQQFAADQSRQIENNHQSNHLLAEYWKQFVQIEQIPPAQFLTIENSLKSISELVLSLIEDRERNLEADVAGNDKFKQIDELVAQLTKASIEYNKTIVSSNQVIEAYKKQLIETKSVDIERRLLVLNDTKTRFSQDTDTLCNKIIELRQKKEKAEGVKGAKRKQLDDYTKEVFPKYQTLINEFLAKFGSTFSITDKASTHLGGKPGTSYKLVINETSFDVGDSSTPEHVPSFSNTLSEGEKSTLAFCYFLARLALDQNIADKIVVLDDPLSSFDSYRRDLTKQEIKRLSQRAKQVIVLSHDQHFIMLIWEDAKASSKPLWIHRTAMGSTISEWDIESATQSSYFKDCSKLYACLEKGCNSESEMRDIARAIRPVLEYNLQVRCPAEFTNNGEWLGNYLDTIDKAKVGNPAFALKPQYNDLDDINSFSKRYHHTQNQNADAEPISQTTLEMYVKKTLKAVAGIVTSTSQGES